MLRPADVKNWTPLDPHHGNQHMHLLQFHNLTRPQWTRGHSLCSTGTKLGNCKIPEYSPTVVVAVPINPSQSPRKNNNSRFGRSLLVTRPSPTTRSQSDNTRPVFGMHTSHSSILPQTVLVYTVLNCWSGCWRGRN